MRCSLKVPGFLEPSIHCLTIGRSKAVPECLVARARSSAIQALDANCFMRGPRLLHLATLQPGFEMAKGGDRRGRLQYVRPHSQASGLKGYGSGSRYYTVEFFLILFCFTASLLVLPLVLPPLPPPPFLLLFIPIGILLLLLILACMPSDLHNFSSSYL